MQLNKGSHYEDNSLFPEHMFIQQLPSPQPYQQQKTVPSPNHHEDQSHPHHDSHNNVASINPSQLRFYQQFKKIYTVSHHLALEKARQVDIMDKLCKRVKTLEEKMRDGKDKESLKKDLVSDENKAKRSRRTAEEIEKKYKCEVAYCQRFYGSEGSLQQHIKLKHPELYHKSQSEDSALGNNESYI